MFPFAKTDVVISPDLEITVIDINDFDVEVLKIMDDNFVSICEGNSDTELFVVKKYVIDLFSSKDNKWIMGATAEFFVHLYMKLSGFKQECLFLNLEEGSIKKGFDGYYSLNGEEWLMESKSGSANTKGISHKNKVEEAMDDLVNKVAGKDKTGKKKIPNNPWRNAYAHASHYDVGAADAIRKNIKSLSTDFIKGIYHSLEEFNTIPCGTIFLSGVWAPQKHDEIVDDVKSISEKLKGKKVHAICVTHTSIDLFQKYIRQGVQ